jgi:hypothetical protein
MIPGEIAANPRMPVVANGKDPIVLISIVV